MANRIFPASGRSVEDKALLLLLLLQQTDSAVRRGTASEVKAHHPALRQLRRLAVVVANVEVRKQREWRRTAFRLQRLEMPARASRVICLFSPRRRN
jgi:hypothetical protein